LQLLRGEIIADLVDALKTHPLSKPLLDAGTLVVTYFTATAAGTEACIAAGAADALKRANLTQTPLSFLLPAEC